MTPCDPTAFPGRQRLEAWGVNRCPIDQLQRLEPAVETLSTSFTSERPEQFTIYLDNPDVLTAYALAFAPQTYARVYDAVSGILARLPKFPSRPLKILDLGSGIGSAGYFKKQRAGENHRSLAGIQENGGDSEISGKGTADLQAGLR